MSGTGFCEVCTSRIEGRRGDAKHCSPACTRRAYAERHLPALRAALAYLAREVRRLENQVSGERRRAGRNRSG